MPVSYSFTMVTFMLICLNQKKKTKQNRGGVEISVKAEPGRKSPRQFLPPDPEAAVELEKCADGKGKPSKSKDLRKVTECVGIPGIGDKGLGLKAGTAGHGGLEGA